ncbi:amidohydrolase [Pyrofollis japonicus]|uniref:amidohydrolase n=1 Tax=Pyrofollis japonicus TaxID=3060460 RepID=UPI00295BF9A7|nr:amidohydrolase [Pyrofollis japonicus]BEP17995.1 amidohydrolase [Pyrofollis japonicus]
MMHECPSLIRARRIYTSFKPTKYVESIVVLNGRVVYAGEATEAAQIARDLARSASCGRPRLYEFDGVALPGFVDAHLHVQGIGLYKYSIKLNDVESLDDLLARVSKESKRFSEWIIGRGWDQERMGTWPTRFDLDEVVSDKPVILMRVCGHAAVLNTEAMKRLGLLDDRSSPLIDRGCNGEPTGIVFEELAERAYREAVKSLDPLKLVIEGVNEALKHGITMIGTMDVDEHAFRGLVSAWNMGLLRIRVRAYISKELFDKFYSIGAVPVFGGPFFRISGVKIYMDGSLGARTAWLREPYSDDPGNKGRPLLRAPEVAEVARKAKEWGLDVAAHAIGDAAILEAIKGFRMSDCGCRIEHASLAPPDVLEELSSMNIRVAVQPRFLISDWWAHERLGERTRWLYPFRSMLNKGIVIGFSSDAPVEPLNPLEGVYAAVTRGSLLSYTREEAIDPETALHLYTAGSAQVLGEPRAGCLEPGCFGDLAILSEDPLEVDVEDLPGLRIDATIVGGELVWEKQ